MEETFKHMRLVYDMGKETNVSVVYWHPYGFPMRLGCFIGTGDVNSDREYAERNFVERYAEANR